MKNKIILMLLCFLGLQFILVNVSYFVYHQQPPAFSIYQASVLMFVILFINQKN